ncbi:hypothetical protein Tco_1284638 [Tanacetum coccineum]
MNPQETQQVAARDEKWVPFTERVKISYINVRLETTVPQKEETFQVVINLIKNSSCFKAFTIFADVLEIFMQQFWYSIKKVQGTNYYEFLLANKKCVVNADVFRTILDICPKVKGVNFNDVSNDDTTLAFLIKLCYKGPLYKYTKMFVDHMYQPWRTLEAIINKCLSGKTASNDKLCKSRIDILWGMFYRENVDYPELIWEDLAYQIDHRKDKRSRREDYQEYGLSIPETMLTEAIKQSESYQIFIKYSTGQIPPRRAAKESEPEPEPVKRKTSSKRRVKKKVTLSTDDNIISDDPDTALELESVPEPTKRRKSSKMTSDHPKKLKGVPSLTLEEQEAANIMQALIESKKTNKRQPSTRGSSKGTVIIIENDSKDKKVNTQKKTNLMMKRRMIKKGDVDDEDDETESNEDDIYI